MTKEDYFKFLDELRVSGVTNMWGASQYLEVGFNLPKKEAAEVLIEWIQTFSQRKEAGEVA